MFTSWIGPLLVILGIVGMLAALRVIRGPIRSMEDYLQPPNPPSKRVQRGIASSKQGDDNEQVLWESREHPISLVAPLKNWKVDATLFAAISTGFFLNTNHALLLWVTTVAVIGFWVLVWDRTRICVTDRRLLVISGILNVKHKTMPLSKMTDQLTEYNWASNILAWLRIIQIQYATLDVESAGQQQALSKILYVPHGPQVNRLIMHRVLKPPK